jgi:N-acetyl-gamma-glutamyl-phosphate reductase
VYGLPELHSGQRESIIQAKNVSNPGCYPSAFVLLARPLIDAGLVSEDAPFSIHALSGYSGGGRSMIEKWESPDIGLESLPHEVPYSLDKMHKHIPEMVKYASLTAEPQFVPAVGPFRCGMRVEVPIHASLLSQRADGAKVWETFHKLYENETFVKVASMAEPGAVDEWSFDPQSCNDTNLIELHVVPHPSGHLLLVALLDNLGKGASGAAIQNLNLMLGISENTGLPEASD